MIKFSEYFSCWVHEEYYAKGVKIGREGDFYTSVSVGYLFGAALANYFIRLISKSHLETDCAVVEIGANDGAMMADFIQGVYTLAPELLKSVRFIIVEPHEKLISMQKQTFSERFGEEVFVEWVRDLDELRLDEAFVISNELFDSFACELINGDEMAFFDENRGIIWDKALPKISTAASSAGVLKGEFSPIYREFARKLSRAVDSGRFISFDYGEWAHRGDFSLRIYKNHDVFNFFEVENLDEFFGTCDITYDVCFSYLAQCFASEGWRMSSYKTQASALLGECAVTELVEIIQKRGGENAAKNALKQLKYLTMPSFLGERFKFIEFVTGVESC
ncbi:SAM-dependent methyltransferase [Campylobacter sp. 19-13652]|uniref:SAM-dependent methyltransferase n=1 Tax=Campylobacter sp. 19-13652 TaxID=2840180 RepID=UPI001C78B81D|nr:SAM-dependent methyltransferase [Campylobacter sp. 19-13652]BCX79343.1 hypothetical protein LBC_08050 [Campylobacter sp. 19-13652]